MGHAGLVATAVSLLLLHGATASVADAADHPVRPAISAREVRSAAQHIKFRDDDPEGQRIAGKLLAKQIAEDKRWTSEVPRLPTAWVKVSASEGPALFVLYGCSPVGNCELYGFKRSKRGWRRVLDSIAQACAVLPSSHEGRRDLSASMHGSATESTIKTYSWRKGRYVRVSMRNVTFGR